MPPLLSAFDELHEILAAASAIGLAVWGFAAGRRPHKAVAVLILLDWLSGPVFQLTLSRYQRTDALALTALLLLAAYAGLVWLYGSAWLTVITGLQGFSVLLQAAAYFDRGTQMAPYTVLLNGIGWAIFAVYALVLTMRWLERAEAIDRLKSKATSYAERT